MSPVNPSSSSSRKCRSCGKPFEPREAHHTTCSNCFRQARDGGSGGGSSTPSQATAFPADYLAQGYFDTEGNIIQDLVATVPEQLARALGVGGVTSTQLRRFYTMAKTVEQKLDAGEPFASVVGRILELKQHAANAVGKAQGKNDQEGLELLKQFIDRNVDKASKDEKSFRRGFLLHFQGVLAYFKYINPKK